LLGRLSLEVGIPSKLVELAVTDEHARVRQWIAHFGSLYGEHEEQLTRDPDEFVRACLRENPSRNDFWLSKHWQEAFESATHLERLAIVRNPHVDYDLIEKIFDPDNQQFGLNKEARVQLASAFLTNEDALDRGQTSYGDWCRRVGFEDAIRFVHAHQRAREHFDKLWALAAKWPATDVEFGVRYWVYRHVGADDKTKAETYKTCQEPALRRGILRNARPPVDPYGSSHSEDRSTGETTKLGLQDDDYECRRLALDCAGHWPEHKKLNYVSYAWSVLRAAVPNAVAIALALKILSSASTTFETIVFALLILIFGGVAWMSVSRGVLEAEQAVCDARRHLRLLELLRDPLYTEESKEALGRPLSQHEQAVGKNRALLIIQSIWSTALTAIALYYLVRSLF
jgi:hypothetical protein